MYGPAQAEMKAFIAYSEANWATLLQAPENIAETFTLLAAAEAKAPAASLYAQRIALVSDYLRPLHDLREQLRRSTQREGNKVLRVNDRDISQLKIDGRLDEPLWKQLAGYQSGDLVDPTTGQPPHPRRKTHFGLFWADGSLYFGIRCEEPDLAGATITGTHNDDPRILEGDHVRLAFETQTHGIYDLAINPAGLILDLDHHDGDHPEWTANAVTAVSSDDHSWSVEIRLPVAGDGQDGIDPTNGISGRKPAATYPWYFNLTRQRIRPGATETTYLSPTDTFLNPDHFARLNGYAHKNTWEEEKKRREEAEEK